MYNDIEYDLVPLGLPNIVYAFEKGGVKPIALHPFMEPLLTKLAKARPKWTIVGVDYNYYGKNNDLLATRFAVYEGGEKLGIINKDYTYSRGGGDQYAIDNKRMTDKRQRGSATTTKDVSKAFKIITREFHAKTPQEVLKEAEGITGAALSTVSGHRHGQYRYAESRLELTMRDFALANWQEYAEFARSKGAHSGVVETFHDLINERDEVVALSMASNSKKAMVVALRGNDYIVKQNDVVTILSNDQLTPHMRRCVGLLKLAGKGDFIPNVGIKGDSKCMLIMPEPEVANVPEC